MHPLPVCPVEISVPVVVTMPLHDHVVAALQGSDRLSAVSKAGYVARLTALQRLTGHGLKRVLLQPTACSKETPMPSRPRTGGQYTEGLCEQYTSSAEAH